MKPQKPIRTNSILALAAVSLAFLAGTVSEAQNYSNALMTLSTPPVAYWPLTENVPAPAGQYIATNSGTAGAMADGCYASWWAAANNVLYSTNNVQHVASVTSDLGNALQGGGLGQYVAFPRFTNGVANPAVTIKAPFSIEIWAKPASVSVGVAPLVVEGRNNVGNGNYAGFCLGQYQNKFFFDLYNTNGTANQPEISAQNLVAGTWYHVVVTFDGTAQSIYTNGVLAQTLNVTSRNGAGLYYVPDPISPLLVGTGTELGTANGGNLYPGILDEMAIYTNALPLGRIQAHYGARTSGYAAAVLTDNPLIYLHLDEPAMASGTPVPTSAVAANYGTLGSAANGYYLPGTGPGVAGPPYSGFGSPSYAVAIGGFNAGVDVGGGALPAVLNPTGNSPLTVAAWFKGNPADCYQRFQALVGHSDSSWRLTLDSAGANRFNPGPGPELSFSSPAEVLANGMFVNDGNWHFVAGVSDGATDSLYVDGVLVKSGSGVGSIVGSGSDIILGGDPQYMAPALNGGGRFFSGSLAHVAFFTNALSTAQIQQIYSAAANFPPILRSQPVGQTTFSGQNVSFNILVSGSATLNYQWYKDGSQFSGKTSATLAFNPAAGSDSGSYFVVVTNDYGAVTSAVVQLTVAAPALGYASAVKALNPSAYWPLDETTPPPFGSYIATNLGTAGAAGQGYYETWFQPITGPTGQPIYYQTNNIQHVPGAIGDGGSALWCSRTNGQGAYVVFPRATNGVPNPAVTLVPPFSVEFWAKPAVTSNSVMAIVTEGRNPALDDTYATTNQSGFCIGQYGGNVFFATWNNRGGDSTKYEQGVPWTAGTWHHVVFTFDGTNKICYLDSAQANKQVLPNSIANTKGQLYTVDMTSPLVLGTGSIPSSGNGASSWWGALAEVAIYTNVLQLSDVQAHYSVATATDSSYRDAVLANNPSIYVRLGEPAFNSYPNPSTYPVASNYGSAGSLANGLYQPGTAPGVSGPPYAGFGASSRAVAFNGFSGAVDIGRGALPYQLNPIGNQPLTVSAWVQGSPADAPQRFQSIVSHGSSSWRLAIDSYSAGLRFNPGNNPEVQYSSVVDVKNSGAIVNDGNWHFVTGVSDGATASLYIDGVLARSSNSVASVAGSGIDALIGGDPSVLVPIWNGSVTTSPRYFNGKIAQVAFFNYALTAAQITNLYTAAGVAPFITLQPPATVNVLAGQAVAIPIAAKGSPTLAYQWYRTTTGAVAGQTTAILSFSAVALANAGTYYAVVTNTAGAATSSVVALTVTGPPVLTQQSPTDVRVFAGTAPILRASVSGSPPLSYQWSKDSVAIPGANASSYVPDTGAIGVHTYSCAITNIYSANVPTVINTITVNVLADPTAPFPQAVLADQPLNYFRLEERPDNGLGNNGLTAYDNAGGLNATYTNSVIGQAGYTSGFAVQSDPSETAASFGANGTPNSYAGNVSSYLNFGVSNGVSAQFTIEAWVNGGSGQSTNAGIVTLGYGNGGEQFCIDTGGGSTYNYRFFVRDAAGAAYAANSSLAPNDNRWHHLTAVCDQPNGKLYFYVDGLLNASGAISTGSGLLSSALPLTIGSRQEGNGSAFDSQFSGSIDEVAIYGAALSSNQVMAHYLATGIAPVFTQFPTNELITVNEGSTVRITASAYGTAPLAYQWFDLTSGFLVPLAGQTNAVLTLSNVTAAMNYSSYSVSVTNLYGSEDLASMYISAQLQIVAGSPYIETDIQPLLATNWTGTPQSFTVTVRGTAPRYQWWQDDVRLPSGTNSSLTVSTLSGVHSYYLAVTNDQGYAISSMATNVGIVRPVLNPQDYNYRMKITFAGYDRSETLADFPVLVNLGTHLPGFSYGQLASPSGGDLRFADSTGTNQLAHEIDEWNPGGVSKLWVQVPRLSSANDSIWAYWGNPLNTAPPGSCTNGAVWLPQSWEGLPGFQLVYHLNESAFPYADSALQYPASTGVAPTPDTGVVGIGQTFGGAPYLDPGPITNLDSTFTLSAWVNISPTVNDIQMIWSEKQGALGWNDNGFAFFVNQYQSHDGVLKFETGDGVGGTAAVSAAGAVNFGQWHMVAAVVDKTVNRARLFVDGVVVTSGTGPTYPNFATENSIHLGRGLTGGFGLKGSMDEVRIQAGTNSVNWVWASYMTVAQNAAFQNYSAISSSLVTLSYTVINGQLVLSWPNGTLQRANEATGQYNDLTGVTSPYTNSLVGPQQFYRVRVR